MPALIFMLFLTLAPVAQGGSVHIAVAANFKQTATAINRLFHDSTGHKTTLSSASTGVLHSQITHGAPFDVFLAADKHSPETLDAAGYGVTGQRFCYAMGQLVLVGGSGSLKDLDDTALSLAIANPATAPYGRAAEELLGRPEYSSGRERKIVRAHNVVQAYQYWHSATVDLALVAKSLTSGPSTAIPLDLYPPLEQQAILLQRAAGNPAARSYMEFLQSNTVRALIDSAGYAGCQ